MLTKEWVILELETLSEPELDEVADYLAFLKFRSRTHAIPQYDDNEVSMLYTQFAEEDRQLAEEGMNDYYHALQHEDEL